MNEDPPGPAHDGNTLSDAHAPGRQRTRRTLLITVVALAIGTAGAVWFLREASINTSSTPAAASSEATMAPTDDATQETAPTPSALPTPQDSVQPSTVTPQPSGVPAQREIIAIPPLYVEATCNGQSGVDSGWRPVNLDASLLIDGRSDTAWRCTYAVDGERLTWDPAKNRAIGESATFYFSNPVTVEGARFIPGYTKLDPSDGANRYAGNGRPTLVEWQFGDGAGVLQEVQPKPSTSRPNCKFSQGACQLGEGWWSDVARNPDPTIPVLSVTLTIRAIQQGNDNQLTNSAGISEVEILGYP